MTPIDPAGLIALAILFAVALMTLVWFLAIRVENLGIVDVAWSLGFLPLALFFALATQGNPARRCLIGCLSAVWSLRLGAHLAIRVAGLHPKEDVRYAQLRTEWGARWRSKSFLFFQFQALILAGLSFVFLIPCLNPAEGIAPLEISGAVLWLVAIAGEAVADRQLTRFKADPANRGLVCQSGLWRYSRHPNYFFEWLVWVAFAVIAAASPWGLAAAICPCLMLYFLLFVTGIPLTEKMSLKSRGEAYREYQRTTSAFVPWFRRKGAQRPLSTGHDS